MGTTLMLMPILEATIHATAILCCGNPTVLVCEASHAHTFLSCTHVQLWAIVCIYTDVPVSAPVYVCLHLWGYRSVSACICSHICACMRICVMHIFAMVPEQGTCLPAMLTHLIVPVYGSQSAFGRNSSCHIPNRIARAFFEPGYTHVCACAMYAVAGGLMHAPSPKPYMDSLCM